ncbi:MAG: thermonuclease family protein [Candidatus Omnitrophica bacterium]|nr:thermonuclease family protein [Candidatus Omnitrophota bacterium]
MSRYFYLVILCLMTSSVVAAEEGDELIHSTSKQEQVLVVKVTNTDTIILENGQRIKLLGIESFGLPPRSYIKYDDKGRPIENKETEATIPLEEQAIVFAQNLMEGKKVKLEYDVESRDDRGYKTAYVYLPDGHMANTELLRQGFVRLKIRPPNVKHAALFRNAYQEGRKEQRGFLSD